MFFRPAKHDRYGKGPCCIALLFAFAWAGPAPARVYHTVDEALQRAYPSSSSIERRTIYLTDDERDKASSFAGAPVESGLVHPYEVFDDAGDIIGTIYFDTHRVRTLAETIMVAVSGEGEVAHVEILSFMEPEEYLPKPRWYEQFLGRQLDPDLVMKRGLDGITGATLSARAATDAVRRILAIHRALGERP